MFGGEGVGKPGDQIHQVYLQKLGCIGFDGRNHEVISSPQNETEQIMCHSDITTAWGLGRRENVHQPLDTSTSE